MKTFLIHISLLAISIFPALSVYPQSADSVAVHFYDIIKDDSVVMYFDNSNFFTGKECMAFKRYTRIDENGDFLSTFIDMDTSGNIIGKGCYEKGIKSGLFELYHKNGMLKCRGNFKNNLPDSIWDYYYINGQLERKLKFTETEMLLLEAYTYEGKKTVTNGNGTFSGNVYYKNIYSRLIATGNIAGGKPDGNWTSTYGGWAYCTEKYVKGVFKGGEYPKAVFNNKTSYTENPNLNNFFLGMYIEELENFKTSKCHFFKPGSSFRPDTSSNHSYSAKKVNLSIDLSNFRSYMNDALDRVLESDLKINGRSEYDGRENVLKITFKVKDDGTPYDFTKITSWGDQYFSEITGVLAMHAKLPASGNSKLTFTLEVTDNAGRSISYTYYFTEE